MINVIHLAPLQWLLLVKYDITMSYDDIFTQCYNQETYYTCILFCQHFVYTVMIQKRNVIFLLVFFFFLTSVLCVKIKPCSKTLTSKFRYHHVWRSIGKGITFQNVSRQSSGTHCTWTLTSNVLKSTPFPNEASHISFAMSRSTEFFLKRLTSNFGYITGTSVFTRLRKAIEEHLYGGLLQWRIQRVVKLLEGEQE